LIFEAFCDFVSFVDEKWTAQNSQSLRTVNIWKVTIVRLKLQNLPQMKSPVFFAIILCQSYSWKFFSHYRSIISQNLQKSFASPDKNVENEGNNEPKFTVDIFGDISSSDEEILKTMRQKRLLTNDAWQSRLCRDSHCGNWQGINSS
jgi:hypothetical protein